MERLFSGIQPSGELHIGNYIGAIKNWVSLTEHFDSIFCIVDYHAATIEYVPEGMPSRIMELAAGLLACGLEQTDCRLFIQSQVPEHTELAWIFNTITPIGELSRMTQYKEKSKQHSDNINVGLFGYPVLQAADILLYKASAVPVGEDQVQHVEFCREVARKFNARYGETFPESRAILTKGARILGLDGQHKMSKSLNNHIGILDSPEVIWEKLRPAYTDSARKRRSDPGNPQLCNIFSYHSHFSASDEIMHIDSECRKAGIGCIECKKILHKNMMKILDPIRERAFVLNNSKNKILARLADGRDKCSVIARDTMREVKEKMGLIF
jgi:tryptophanyl-tRNA synthetase